MKRFVLFCAGAALFFAGAAAGRHYDAREAQAAQKEEQLPLKKLRELAEAIEIIRESYVDEVSREDLMESAVRGVLDGLDPHSVYLSAEELKSFEKGLSGERYGGVGIYLGEKSGWIQIVAPLDGSPASRAGLAAGDLIIRIDGVSTHRMEIEKAVKLMRGKVGAMLEIEVLRPSDSSRRTVELRREIIVAPSVVAGISEPGYGYLRISRFQNQTVADLLKSLSALYRESEADGGLRGLVVDLRNNPGGVLHASVGVASVFLPGGVTVVSDRGRAQESKHFVAERKYYRGFPFAEEAREVPMVVLVNEGSASASEIVAGALQDHKRAVLLGARTYGKASVQTIMRLRSTEGKTALKLTMARYYTPLGRNIQARGIEPDIKVAAAASAPENEGETESINPIREADLQGHLQNETKTKQLPQPNNKNNSNNKTKDANKDKDKDKNNTVPATEKTTPDPKRPFIPVNDYQYDQAMVILKALSVAQVK